MLQMLQIKLKIYFQNIKNKYNLTPFPRLHQTWLKQTLSKSFIPSPITLLGPIFL